MTIRIFVNPSGQKDNLGDSILRRAYLNALRRHGELHVFAGTHSEYVSGLGLRPEDIVYRSRRSWLVAALHGNPAKEKTSFAMNAGEWVLDRRFLVNSLWQSLLLLRCRISRGRSVALGIAVRRNQNRPARSYFQTMLRLVATVSWRDPESGADFGLGTVAPDWAFALGSASEDFRALGERGSIAVVLRGDRPAPGSAWIGAVRALADEHSCRVVVVNQMREDEARCEELAKALDGEVLAWAPGIPHSAQEERVRSVYRDSVAVVSDRIHALILGVTEGAVPIGFTTGDPEKVRRTFAALTDLPVAFAEADVDDLDDALKRSRDLIGAHRSVVQNLADGRRRLDELGKNLSLG
ncbi:polysaccharide pyruvyl transferase WcaK-like protein [Rathayibacter sp. PhB127]|uniref:polysaccharide pyruvyl transferase family protein n=1 Tax=Rathayibacter sp. PhB127 TaxID=2485176 RepID=UPI000F4BBA30|nr:polysaccharide pyruvyl transferase family protein [Rathayibacter sp. PhB127]ROS29303.1 polysaccharide pyruvyl transferase WcaK-like protein [Rathayibacter sp. PhB127]